VQRIRKSLDEKNLSAPDKYYFVVYNLGIDGDTTEGLLKRFETELRRRIYDEEETVIIFSIGGNDAVYLKKEKNHYVPIDKFEENIKKLISQARKYTDKIIINGLFPVDKKKTTPVPWEANMIYNNIYIERYNSKLRNICEKEKVEFIDLYGEVIKRDYKNFLSYDGLHPSSEGHKWIAGRVIKLIDKK